MGSSQTQRSQQKSRCLSGLWGSCPKASLVLSIDSVWRLQPSGVDFVSRETSCESHARLSSSPAAQRSITCGQEKGSRTAFSWPVALAGQQAPPSPEQAWSTLRAPLSDRPPGVKLWTALFSASSDHSKPFPEASQLGAADQRARLRGPGGIYVQLSYMMSPCRAVPSEETSLGQVDCNIPFMSGHSSSSWRAPCPGQDGCSGCDRLRLGGQRH